MQSNVIQFEPAAAGATPADQAEPLEAAMRELSARIAEDTGRLRRGYARANELGSRIPSLRRKHERPTRPVPSAPVTFYSIEEAASEPLAAPRAARGGR